MGRGLQDNALLDDRAARPPPRLARGARRQLVEPRGLQGAAAAGAGQIAQELPIGFVSECHGGEFDAGPERRPCPCLIRRRGAPVGHEEHEAAREA